MLESNINLTIVLIDIFSTQTQIPLFQILSISKTGMLQLLPSRDEKVRGRETAACQRNKKQKESRVSTVWGVLEGYKPSHSRNLLEFMHHESQAHAPSSNRRGEGRASSRA
jgi:hypothetical protein